MFYSAQVVPIPADIELDGIYFVFRPLTKKEIIISLVISAAGETGGEINTLTHPQFNTAENNKLKVWPN